MKRKVNAVIFDQDGVMFDTERMSAEAWELAGQETGVFLREDFLCTIRGMNAQDAAARYCQVYGAEPGEFEELRRKKKCHFDRLIAERGVPVKPGLAELLAYLKKQGIKTAMATGSMRDYSMRNLNGAGIADYFPVLITGDMVEQSKPSPEVFLKAAAALGEEPGHCMVLEDSLNGVEAGIRGGFITVMVPDLTRPDEALAKRLFRVCESLTEVKDLLEENGGWVCM